MKQSITAQENPTDENGLCQERILSQELGIPLELAICKIII